MNYKITLTEYQLRTISNACEVLARLGIGQFEDALEHMPTKEFRPRGWHDDMRAIGTILKKYTIDSVDGWHSNLGINNQATRKESKIAWELHQTIRHRLSWESAIQDGLVKSMAGKRTSEMFGVNYDEPTSMTGEPLPTIHKMAETAK